MMLTKTEAAECVKSHMKDYLESRGIDVRRNFSCLFSGHRDSGPSMHFYEKDHSVYCFGCGKRADLVELIKEETGKTGRDLFEYIYHDLYSLQVEGYDDDGGPKKKNYFFITLEEARLIGIDFPKFGSLDSKEKQENLYKFCLQQIEKRKENNDGCLRVALFDFQNLMKDFPEESPERLWQIAFQYSNALTADKLEELDALKEKLIRRFMHNK